MKLLLPGAVTQQRASYEEADTESALWKWGEFVRGLLQAEGGDCQAEVLKRKKE